MRFDNISREARRPAGRGTWEGPASADIDVTVTAGQDALDRAAGLLAGIEGGLEKAMKRALSRTTSYLRTESTRAIRERYAISAAGIRANENVSVRYSYQNGVQVYITFAGYRIPLHRFDGSGPLNPSYDTSRRIPVMFGPDKWSLLHPGSPAYGHVLKGTSAKSFPNAFAARMKTGHVGIFERTGGMTSHDKDEIEELFGPSVAQMLDSPEVSERLTARAEQAFEKQLDHGIIALMNGWGW